MTKKEANELLNSFQNQQKELLAVIEKYGGELHQNDFDKEFEDLVIIDNKVYRNSRTFGFTGLTFCLHNSSLYHCEWAKWLQLLMFMIFLGKIKIKGNLPDVYYCVNQTGAA